MSACLRPLNLGTQIVPCGSCLSCLETRQKVWYFRNMLEYHFNSVQAFFITLTYDDVFLPLGKFKDIYIPLLYKKDFLGFIKRLRYHIPKFRYFGVSEYSPSPANRPHFHFIMYLKNPLDLEFVIESVYRSWSKPYSSRKEFRPFGLVNVEKLTAGRISYVTNYLLVKIFNEHYDELAPEVRPKAFMSRHPGIGDRIEDKTFVQYVQQHPYEDLMYFPDGSPFSMPRYYRERIYLATTRRYKRIYNKLENFSRPQLSDSYLSYTKRELYKKYYLKSLKRSCNQ